MGSGMAAGAAFRQRRVRDVGAVRSFSTLHVCNANERIQHTVASYERLRSAANTGDSVSVALRLSHQMKFVRTSICIYVTSNLWPSDSVRVGGGIGSPPLGPLGSLQ